MSSLQVPRCHSDPVVAVICFTILSCAAFARLFPILRPIDSFLEEFIEAVPHGSALVVSPGVRVMVFAVDFLARPLELSAPNAAVLVCIFGTRLTWSFVRTLFTWLGCLWQRLHWDFVENRVRDCATVSWCSELHSCVVRYCLLRCSSLGSNVCSVCVSAVGGIQFSSCLAFLLFWEVNAAWLWLLNKVPGCPEGAEEKPNWLIELRKVWFRRSGCWSIHTLVSDRFPRNGASWGVSSTRAVPLGARHNSCLCSSRCNCVQRGAETHHAMSQCVIPSTEGEASSLPSFSHVGAYRNTSLVSVFCRKLQESRIRSPWRIGKEDRRFLWPWWPLSVLQHPPRSQPEQPARHDVDIARLWSSLVAPPAGNLALHIVRRRVIARASYYGLSSMFDYRPEVVM